MKRRRFLALLLVLPFSADAAPPLTEAEKASAVAAIKAYLATVQAKDFEGLYERHFHSAVKARVTKEHFTKRMEAGFADTLQRLCVEILAAHDKGAGLTIASMESPLVPGTIVVELQKPKLPAQDEVIKPSNAFRIELAPDPKELKFYDID